MPWKKLAKSPLKNFIISGACIVKNGGASATRRKIKKNGGVRGAGKKIIMEALSKAE
jgi:hypothetical protein